MDIESKLITWLNSKLSADVYADVPSLRPASFLTVERVGGGTDSVVISRPRVAIQCWSTSRAEAAALAYLVESTLPELAGETDISKVEINSLYNFPDETGNTARYQIVVNIVTT